MVTAIVSTMTSITYLLAIVLLFPLMAMAVDPINDPSILLNPENCLKAGNPDVFYCIGIKGPFNGKLVASQAGEGMFE